MGVTFVNILSEAENVNDKVADKSFCLQQFIGTDGDVDFNYTKNAPGTFTHPAISVCLSTIITTVVLVVFVLSSELLTVSKISDKFGETDYFVLKTFSAYTLQQHGS